MSCMGFVEQHHIFLKTFVSAQQYNALTIIVPTLASFLADTEARKARGHSLATFTKDYKEHSALITRARKRMSAGSVICETS